MRRTVMSTIFTQIIEGRIPARMVWSDDTCVAFLSINPLGPGHSLVVPRAEVERWTECDPELLAHLTIVARTIAKEIETVWTPPRVGLTIAGFDVPHLHLHVFSAWDLGSFDFAGAAEEIDAAEQDGYAEQLRAALRAAGHGARVPD